MLLLPLSWLLVQPNDLCFQCFVCLQVPVRSRVQLNWRCCFTMNHQLLFCTRLVGRQSDLAVSYV